MILKNESKLVRKSANTVLPQKVTLGTVKTRDLLFLSGVTSMVWSRCENIVKRLSAPVSPNGLTKKGHPNHENHKSKAVVTLIGFTCEASDWVVVASLHQ